ncbi:MAG: aldo/keto reductase [Deltaproteobacteria bacterium]|nr:aldo/keto reductase [Deltaproteobacteria bacterium]
MTSKNKNYSRRDFFKTAGAAGAGAIIAPNILKAADKTESESSDNAIVTTRPFGKTGVSVPTLSLGGIFDIPANQIILNLAFKFGVTYWDTANMYGGGLSEEGVGIFFNKRPDVRKKIFLVTKSTSRDSEGMTEHLELSLKRMNTNYIDLYFLHSFGSMNELSDEVRKWAEKQKSKGKIKLFGFSTHKNMEKCMMGASKLNWIDGIMMSYNFRLMQKPEMKEAVQACFEKGIGLTAMKSQGGGSVKTETDTELKMAGRFIKQGFTPEQAKLKAVWEDNRISSICSLMTNSTILMANIAAALDRTSLATRDMDLLNQYACETSSDYCAGCGHICESAIKGKVPISDIMRHLMYHRSYGEKGSTETLDRKPAVNMKHMASLDFSLAEKKCPQKMAIGDLMKEAAEVLS